MGRLLGLRTRSSSGLLGMNKRMQVEQMLASPVRAFWSGGSELNQVKNCAISVENVTFRYPASSKKVLDKVCLEVEQGTFHILLGANGCGKSTLLRCLANLVSPESGRIQMDQNFGYVFQNPDNQVVLPSVFSDVAFGLGKYSVLTEQDVNALVMHSLERVGMAEFADRQTSSLSGGQKQRVAIAGILAENPRILLLDELTTFLDGSDQMKVVKCVRDVVHPAKANDMDQQVTAVWVTHRLEELEYADYVSFMDDGKILWTARPDEAKKRMKSLGAVMN